MPRLIQRLSLQDDAAPVTIGDGSSVARDLRFSAAEFALPRWLRIGGGGGRVVKIDRLPLQLSVVGGLIELLTADPTGGGGGRVTHIFTAERPREWVDFSITPTSFATSVTVGPGGDHANLAAWKAAGPHDTTGNYELRLTVGLHLMTGSSFVFDAGCFTGGGHVLVRSVDESAVPARGVRATEAHYPGVSHTVATIRSAGIANARCWDLENSLRGNVASLTLRGLRFEPSPGMVVQGSSIKIGTGTPNPVDWPENIILDRVVVAGHGPRPAPEYRRAVQLNAGNRIGTIDSSYLGCDNPNSDSNAWQILSVRVFTSVNNRYEAGSEAVIYGGAPNPAGGIPQDFGHYGDSFGPGPGWPGVVLNIKNGGKPEVKYGRYGECVHCYGANVDSSGQNGHADHYKTANQGSQNPNVFAADIATFECGVEHCTAWYSPLGCNGNDGPGLRRVGIQDQLIWNCGEKWSAPVGASNPSAARELVTFVPSTDINGEWTPKDHDIARVSSWMGDCHIVLENTSLIAQCDGFGFRDVIASESPSPNYSLFRSGGAQGSDILGAFTNVRTGGSVFPNPRNGTSYGPSLGHIQVANEAALLYTDPDNGDLTLQAGSPAIGIGVTAPDSGCRNPAAVKAKVDQAKAGTYTWSGSPPDPMP